MTRKKTKKGRTRANLLAAVPSARPLIVAKDHGDPIAIKAHHVGAIGERWIEPFLVANMANLRRMDVSTEVLAAADLTVMIRPGSRVGAIPLLNPSTRKVAAGLLIKPRFEWTGLGAVFNAIGFSVEPGLGGAPLVPGSAREVPPWILAGPVIERIAGLLRHQRRGFIERTEKRASPRGRVNWTTWATTQLPRGSWTIFPCQYSEPDDDPDMIASIRWTLSRLEEELTAVAWSLPARYLLKRTAELSSLIGTGITRRPSSSWGRSGSSEWIVAAVEAMSWVAEERGLGGSTSLDGLAWDLSIDAVWEAWVSAFAAELAGQLGMVASPFQATRRLLHWAGPARSMGSLAPDIELRSTDRVIWLDAKYKRHLELLTQRGWGNLSNEYQSEHRADLHQALAYASLSDAPQVDTMLVYPCPAYTDYARPTITTVTSGRRQVRLVLAAVPFGFRNPDHRQHCLQSLREILAA